MSIPKPNVTYPPSDKPQTDLTESDVKGMLCNPVYAGIPPYERMISDEDWVKAATINIQQDGPEQFLVNMLYMLRIAMEATQV